MHPGASPAPGGRRALLRPLAGPRGTRGRSPSIHWLVPRRAAAARPSGALRGLDGTRPSQPCAAAGSACRDPGGCAGRWDPTPGTQQPDPSPAWLFFTLVSGQPVGPQLVLILRFLPLLVKDEESDKNPGSGPNPAERRCHVTTFPSRVISSARGRTRLHRSALCSFCSS